MAENKEEVKEEVTEYTQPPKDVHYDYYITFPERKKIAYLNKPNRNTLGKVMAILYPLDNTTGNYVSAGEVILKECFVGGDADILSDDDLILSGSLQAISLFEIEEAELKKK